MITDIFLLTVFPAAMAFAAATDLVTFTVPNRISVVLLAGFLVLAAMIGLGWSDIGLHVAAGAGALVLGFVFFACGWIGGGDAKLFAATALWLGPAALPSYALIASVLGGGLTLALIYWRGLPLLPATLNAQSWAVRLHDNKQGVPYGIALAAAGLLLYPNSPFMAALGG
jgi:prepilin peptidase CpaA